jgi:putative ABC transport system permease protein
MLWKASARWPEQSALDSVAVSPGLTGLSVAMQTAAVLPIVLCAITLGVSTHSLLGRPLGFVASDSVVMDMWMMDRAYSGAAERRKVLAQLLDNVNTGGAVRLSATTAVPFGGVAGKVRVDVESERRGEATLGNVFVDYRYFSVMGQPLLDGRWFTDTDLAEGPRVAIISSAFAKRSFPDVSAVGHSVRLDPVGRIAIVGVVGDVNGGPGEPDDAVLYLPLSQYDIAKVTLVCRVSLPRSVGPRESCSNEVRRSAPTQPIEDAEFLRDRITVSESPLRVIESVTFAESSAGLIALALSVSCGSIQGRHSRRETRLRTALEAKEPARAALAAHSDMSYAVAGAVAGLTVTPFLSDAMQLIYASIRRPNVFVLASTTAGVLLVVVTAGLWRSSSIGRRESDVDAWLATAVDAEGVGSDQLLDKEWSE